MIIVVRIHILTAFILFLFLENLDRKHAIFHVFNLLIIFLLLLKYQIIYI